MRKIEGDNGTRTHTYTREDDLRISEGRLRIEVVAESGRRGHMPLSQGEALRLAVALVETVREQANIG